MPIFSMGIHTALTPERGAEVLGIRAGQGVIAVPPTWMIRRYTRLLWRYLDHPHTINFGAGVGGEGGWIVWSDLDESSTAPLDFWFQADIPEESIQAILGWDPEGAPVQYLPRSVLMPRMLQLLTLPGRAFSATLAMLVFGEFADMYTGECLEGGRPRRGLLGRRADQINQ